MKANLGYHQESMKHIILSGLLAGLAMAQTQPPTSMPGLKLGLDELKAQYAHVGVGKRLKPKKWPNGARVAVALSFDVDNATVPLSRGDLGSEVICRADMYGAVDGLPRILRVLDKENVPASFFIPAVSAALNPEIVPVDSVAASSQLRSACTAGFTSILACSTMRPRSRAVLNQSIDLLTKADGP